MDRFSKLIEFAFADGDCIVAYAAFDSVKCQGGWPPERATSAQETVPPGMGGGRLCKSSLTHLSNENVNSVVQTT
jgi:hypothetical protein